MVNFLVGLFGLLVGCLISLLVSWSVWFVVWFFGCFFCMDINKNTSGVFRWLVAVSKDLGGGTSAILVLNVWMRL